MGLSKSQTQGELHSQDGGILRRNMDASTAHLPEGFHFDKSFAGRKGVRVLVRGEFGAGARRAGGGVCERPPAVFFPSWWP